MDEKQRGVALGMAFAVVVMIAVFAVGLSLAAEREDIGLSVDARLRVLAVSALAPATALFVCVARLAKHRFFTAEDIDGGGLAQGTPRAALLQALLQNTLEQLALAVPVYAAASLLLPERWVVAVPAAAMMFVVGRTAFMWGYGRGAPSRAFGFGLTFYPTVLLGAGSIVLAVVRSINEGIVR